MKEGVPTQERIIEEINLDEKYAIDIRTLSDSFISPKAATEYINNPRRFELMTYPELRAHTQVRIDKNTEESPNDPVAKRILYNSDTENKLAKVVPEIQHRIRSLLGPEGRGAVSPREVREIRLLLDIASDCLSSGESTGISEVDVDDRMTGYRERVANPVWKMDINEVQGHKSLGITYDYINAFKLTNRFTLNKGRGISSVFSPEQKLLTYEEFYRKQQADYLSWNPDVEIVIRTEKNSQVVDALDLIVGSINSIIDANIGREATSQQIEEIVQLKGLFRQMLDLEITPDDILGKINEITAKYKVVEN